MTTDVKRYVQIIWAYLFISNEWGITHANAAFINVASLKNGGLAHEIISRDNGRFAAIARSDC